MFVFFKFTDCSICFIFHTSRKGEETDFHLMKRGMSGLVHQCGVRSVNYCVISNKNGEAFQPVTFQRQFDEESSLVREILALERETGPAELIDDVREAVNVFRHCQTERKKVCS